MSFTLVQLHAPQPPLIPLHHFQTQVRARGRPSCQSTRRVRPQRCPRLRRRSWCRTQDNYQIRSKGNLGGDQDTPRDGRRGRDQTGRAATRWIQRGAYPVNHCWWWWTNGRGQGCDGHRSCRTDRCTRTICRCCRSRRDGYPRQAFLVSAIARRSVWSCSDDQRGPKVLVDDQTVISLSHFCTIIFPYPTRE